MRRARLCRTLTWMASSLGAKRPSDRLTRAKRQHGKAVAARVKELQRAKSKGIRGPGLTRKDLEALRDGRE
jgi:hypothetical protein